LKLRILSLAFEDLDAGRRFYERQQQGLGEYFLNSLFSDIDALLLYAGIHPKFFGYFRALSDRFPYAIYYRVEGGEIQVWRVLDCRQDPARTARALNDVS
jgi:plasmid stabilization system protein ParE